MRRLIPKLQATTKALGLFEQEKTYKVTGEGGFGYA
jgi:hypothetical protein